MQKQNPRLFSIILIMIILDTIKLYYIFLYFCQMICNNFSVYVKCVCESIKCSSGIPAFCSFQIVKYICVNGMCVIQSNVQFIYYKD